MKPMHLSDEALNRVDHAIMQLRSDLADRRAARGKEASPSQGCQRGQKRRRPECGGSGLCQHGRPPSHCNARSSTEGRHPGELRRNARLGTQGTQVEGDKK